MGKWSADLREKLMHRKYYRWIVFYTVTIGTFMLNVDSSIVTVALPTLQEQFGVGPSILQWVVSAYFLVITSIVPIMGVLSDRVGRKCTFLLGVSIFTLGSVLCALSSSIEQLIFFRVLQSIGASLMMGNIMSIIVNTFPVQERGKPLGIIGSIVAVGTVVGPSIGGILIGQWGWESIFWVNVPFGILSVMLASVLLGPIKSAEGKKEKFDSAGAVLFFVAMTTLLLFVSNGHNWGWGSAASLINLSLTTAAWIFFIVWEFKFPSPLIDLTFFKNSGFTLANIAGYISYVILMFPAFLLPLFFTRILDMPIYQVGLLLAPQAIAIIFFSPAAGWLGQRYGYLWPSMAGMVIAALGLIMMAQFDEQTGYMQIVAAQSLFGVGLGFFTPPNNAQVLESVPIEKTGVTGGILATLRNFGKVSGVALAVFLYHLILDTEDTDHSFTVAVSFVFYVGAALAAAAVLLYVVQLKLNSPKAQNTSAHKRKEQAL